MFSFSTRSSESGFKAFSFVRCRTKWLWGRRYNNPTRRIPYLPLEASWKGGEAGRGLPGRLAQSLAQLCQTSERKSPPHCDQLGWTALASRRACWGWRLPRHAIQPLGRPTTRYARTDIPSTEDCLRIRCEPPSRQSCRKPRRLCIVVFMQSAASALRGRRVPSQHHQRRARTTSTQTTN